MAVSKIAYLTSKYYILLQVSKVFLLTYQTFFLFLLKPFAVSYCLCTMERTQFASWYILLSVLQFFQSYLILPFLLHQIKTFFLLLYFLKFTVYFVLKIYSMFIFDWSKAPVLLYFEKKKTHMIDQKSRPLPDILAQKSSDF